MEQHQLLSLSQEPICGSDLLAPVSVPSLSQIGVGAGDESGAALDLLATQPNNGSQALAAAMEMALNEPRAAAAAAGGSGTASQIARTALANAALKEGCLQIQPLNLGPLPGLDNAGTDAAQAAALPLDKFTADQLLAAAAAAAAAAANQGQQGLIPPPLMSPLAQQQQQQQAELEFMQQQYQLQQACAAQAARHASVTKLEHIGSVAKRRGPMDEMRQLQRILTKLLPASASYMPVGTDGGGNKVQAQQIKIYLTATLGEAPKPDWGLKQGWGQYLADLFNWATGRADITNFQAMECARRQQGRSWEVLYDRLIALGIYSWNWELPLKQQQVLNCTKCPPPELQRQQEALAAATAAAAAAGGGSTALGKRSAAASPTKPPALSLAAALAAADAAAGEGSDAQASKLPRVGDGLQSPAAAAAAAAAALAALSPKKPGAAAAAASAAAAAAGGALSSAIPGAAGLQAAAAAAAAAAGVRLELPDQSQLDAASCEELLDAVERLLHGASQAIQARGLQAADSSSWHVAFSRLQLLQHTFAQFSSSVQAHALQQHSQQQQQQGAMAVAAAAAAQAARFSSPAKGAPSVGAGAGSQAQHLFAGAGAAAAAAGNGGSSNGPQRLGQSAAAGRGADAAAAAGQAAVNPAEAAALAPAAGREDEDGEELPLPWQPLGGAYTAADAALGPSGAGNGAAGSSFAGAAAPAGVNSIMPRKSPRKQRQQRQPVKQEPQAVAGGGGGGVAGRASGEEAGLTAEAAALMLTTMSQGS